MLDLVPDNSGEVSWIKLSSGLSGAGWTWALKARQVISSLFGSNEVPVTNAIARECGIGSGSASTLLAMSAPMVLRFLSRRVYDEGWSMRDLGTKLETEVPAIRSALPVGLSDVLLPRVGASSTSPVIAQSIRHDWSAAGWIGTMTLGLLALGGFWLWTQVRRPSNFTSATLGTANRMVDETAGVGRFVTRQLPGNVVINVPPNGVESRLLDIVQGRGMARTSWLDFDRLTFASGSAAIGAGSSAELDNVAAILKGYPTVNVTIAGFTDDVGSKERNLQLSRERAESVKNELVARGVAPDRLFTQGLGEQVASADKYGSAGRPRNRHVSLQVAER
jgi:outer membrane protein OmpA-like peptidoglycan-associated protein